MSLAKNKYGIYHQNTMQLTPRYTLFETFSPGTLPNLSKSLCIRGLTSGVMYLKVTWELLCQLATFFQSRSSSPFPNLGTGSSIVGKNCEC